MARSGTGLTCGRVRVAGVEGCLDVDASAPVGVGWTVESDADGAVLAESRVRLLDAGGRCLWSSSFPGDVRGAVLPADLVGPGRAYSVEVEAVSPAGERSPVASAAFETGLGAEELTAEWIVPVQRPTTVERWSILDWVRGRRPELPVEQRLRPTQQVRQVFDLGRLPVRARLHASAHGVYRVFLNGVELGDQVLAPGFDSYEHRLSVQAYDATGALAVGENVIGVALADGWWAGRIGLPGSSAHFGDRTAAIWQLELEFADGGRSTVRSGPDAVGAPGPERWADLFIGECFDARRATPGWSAPGFDAAGWAPVAVLDGQREPLVPFGGAPVRRLAELAPVGTRLVDGAWLVDFGQVITGRVRVALPPLPAGASIRIEHTETLDADGRWFVNIDGINKDQADVYLADGTEAGRSWEPSFTFHGFRYARVRSQGAELAAPPELVAVVLGSDLEEVGGFASSDERLNRLHENVVWSQRGNFLSIPTDCPQRERAGWTADTQVFTGAATNNFDSTAFLRRWLANLVADQEADGRVPTISPRSPVDRAAQASGSGLSSIVSCAGWSDAIAIVPWTLYERTGDLAVLESTWPAIRRWVDCCTRTAAAELPEALDAATLDPERLARQRLLWNTGAAFGDWMVPSTLAGGGHAAVMVAPRLTAEFVGPMFQAQTLTILARIADVLGLGAEAAVHREHAAAVRAAFAAEYVSESGALPVDLQGLAVLALAFDMVPERLREKAVDRLADLVHAAGDRLDTGFLSTPHLLDVLYDGGRPDLARALLMQDRRPSWLYEVDRGATTVWESWNAIGEDGGPSTVSLNHFALGAVDDVLFRRIAGIAPAAPGFARVLVAPDLACGLGEARAWRETPYGRVEVAWRRTGSTAHLEVRLPVGVTGVLRLPDGEQALAPGRTALAVEVRGPVLAPAG